ncbi:MAG TPA: MmgE/PrpD family protein [Micromonosporaceae bacterium]
MTGLTQRLTDFVSDFTPEDVPDGVAATVKLALLDTLGVACLSAAGEPGDRSPAPGTGSGPATLIGHPDTVTAAAAAFGNGALIHALDFDDTGASTGHPSSTLIPAGLATCEELGRDGRDFITAYVVGYEVGAVLSKVIRLDRPFHRTSVVGPLAAAAACAWLRGMRGPAVRDALGVAAVMGGSGIRQSFGTTLKPLQVGFAARVGVEAPVLAAAGWIGDAEILESPHGFVAGYSAGSVLHDPEAVDQLGVRLAIASQDASRGVLGGPPTMKPWACCAGNFATLLAVAQATGGRPYAPQDVAEIRVIAITDPEAGALMRPEPRNGLEAKFSLRYTVAAALLDGEVRLDTYDDDQFARITASGMPQRVTVVPSTPLPDSERFAVEVELTDGRVLRGSSDGRRGLPAEPSDVLAKFRRISGGLLAPEAITAVLERVDSFESTPVNAVTELFRTGKRTGREDRTLARPWS